MAGDISNLTPPADDFDVTITSFTHSAEEIQRALDGEPPPDDVDEPGGEDEGVDPPTTPAVASTKAAVVEDPPAEPAKPIPVPGQSDAYEPPVAGETPAARMDRIERNAARLTAVSKTADAQQRHIEALQQQNRELQAAVAAGKGTPDAAPAPAPAVEAPKFKFQSWAEYQDAHADDPEPDSLHERWIDDRTTARLAFERQREADARALEQQAQIAGTVVAAVQAAVTKFSAEQPDFPTVLAASQAPLTTPMRETLYSDVEVGVRVAYDLAKLENLEEARRIAGLKPIEQVRAITRLMDAKAASLAAPPAPKTEAIPDTVTETVTMPVKRKTSTAPAPNTVVSGAGSNPPDPSNMSTDEYIRWYDEDQKRKGRRR